MWRVLQSGNVATTYQFKTNSGASRILSRVNAVAANTGPKVLSTNIAVPAISAGKAALYFLPDRILVREGNRFSDLGYSQLRLHAGDTRFIESGATPRDAVQVDQTWQYVNVKGGPDRRFKNNRVLPIMRYGTIDATSPQGLQWQLQVSRADAAIPVTQAIASVPALHQPVAPPPPPPPPSARIPQTPPRSPAAPPKASRLASAPVNRPQPPPKTDSGFVRANLTRRPTPHPANAVTFTAIDLETTGLDPATDRIVEIGLVMFTADGTILDEFATLVNSPGSDSQAPGSSCPKWLACAHFRVRDGT